MTLNIPGTACGHLMVRKGIAAKKIKYEMEGTFSQGGIGYFLRRLD